jgi:hypothetical protein
VAVRAADGDGHVVAHHLRRHHGYGLALRRVHFAWATSTIKSW